MKSEPTRPPSSAVTALAVVLIAAICPIVRANELAAPEAAKQVDRLLAKELPAESLTASTTPVAAIASNVSVDDETFLRRVWLDVVGQLPSPEEVTRFVLDPSQDKREKLVDRLLADQRFGVNWARYWRDVMLYRRSDDRALIAANSATRYLEEALNRGTGWDEIARSLIGAKGNLNAQGASILIASQWGEIPETAAEVSRVLLGVQIQCAQCHDHPTDRWKRQQFHELAAFFARIAVRPVIEEGERRGFQVVSSDERFKDLPPAAQKKIKAKAKGRNKRLEHFMPDLNDPSVDGTLMEPVFFFTGQKLPVGTSDDERRAALGDWITSKENPWFAKAFVNRIWGELVGVGFYEPIDDLGPDRPCGAPQTLDLLASQFVEHGHDVKWLYRTILLTDAYASPSRQRSPNGDNIATNVCVQPLRSDQLFNALTAALDIDEPPAPASEGRPAAYRGPRTPRGAFQQVFGFDPSTPRDELAASIPQALVMMNQPAINQAISAGKGKSSNGRGTLLARLLASNASDEDIVVELYLRCFAREPKTAELQTCLEYVAEVKNRTDAFEDILWSLVNSTEFLYRQ